MCHLHISLDFDVLHHRPISTEETSVHPLFSGCDVLLNSELTSHFDINTIVNALFGHYVSIAHFLSR